MEVDASRGRLGWTWRAWPGEQAWIVRTSGAAVELSPDSSTLPQSMFLRGSSSCCGLGPAAYGYIGWYFQSAQLKGPHSVVSAHRSGGWAPQPFLRLRSVTRTSPFLQLLCRNGVCASGFTLWMPWNAVSKRIRGKQAAVLCLADTEVTLLFALWRHHKCLSEWTSAGSCDISWSCKWITWQYKHWYWRKELTRRLLYVSVMVWKNGRFHEPVCWPLKQ